MSCWEEAEAIYVEFLPKIRSQYGPDNYRTRLVTSSLAMAHIGRKDFAGAELPSQTLLESLRRNAPTNHRCIAASTAGPLSAESQHTTAEAILRQCPPCEERQPDD